MISRNKTRRLAFCTLALLAALFATGCAQQQTDTNLQPPLHTAENTLDKGVTYAVDVYDPLESMNRRIYMFNYYFDKFLFLPVVNTYKFITPDYVEDRVSDFVDNVFEFNNFTNNVLQLKFDEAAITLGRFVFNTTFGVAGLWDVATFWEWSVSLRISVRPLATTALVMDRILCCRFLVRPTCVIPQE